jgi:hypothetical protein
MDDFENFVELSRHEVSRRKVRDQGQSIFLWAASLKHLTEEVSKAAEVRPEEKDIAAGVSGNAFADHYRHIELPLLSLASLLVKNSAKYFANLGYQTAFDSFG